MFQPPRWVQTGFSLGRRWDNVGVVIALFMLVSALMGLERMHATYRYAIEEGYRFYSYGDSSLLLPGE